MKKILIYDNLFFFSKGLYAVIKSNFPDLDVFLVFSNKLFFEECSNKLYDVVIFDFTNDTTSSFKDLKRIKKLQPQSKLFVFSEIDSIDYKIQCSKGKVDFLLSKNCSEDYLVAALNLALFGNSYFSKSLRLNIPERKIIKKGTVESSKSNSLSLREFEIAMLMIQGYSTSKISNKLNIVPSTISTYKKRLFKKTNSSNVIEIAKFLRVL
ncbi:response regulator transcription factor [Flavobacterium chungnamense]|uniref:HTH luxR-type domain-containing protein n=1 Tax=Flavobacterium chungnamense TaxID=706182 RepID=A0ABP7ULH6_9FLAO